MTGDGLNEEYTGMVHPMKSVNPETVWIIQECDDDGVKGGGVHFAKGDGFETPSEDTIGKDEETFS